MQLLLDLHGASSERVLETVDENDPPLIDKIAEDDLVSKMLVLHGLQQIRGRQDGATLQSMPDKARAMCED